MLRGNLAAKGFVSFDEVVDVGFGVAVVDGGISVGVKRTEVAGPLRVAEVDGSLAGKYLAVAAVAGRHHAVEHIDAQSDGLENVGGGSDPHEVARAVGRQDRADLGGHRVHLVVGFAHAKAANGIAPGAF